MTRPLSSNSASEHSSLFPYWGLLLLYSVIRVFLIPVFGSSEAREAHVIQEIVASGEYILPLRSGLIPSKPPLLHWIGASFVELATIIGIPNLNAGTLPLAAARLVSLCAAFGVLCLLFRFLVRWSSPVGSATISVAPLAVGILLTSYGFFNLALDARVDMLLCFFVTGASLRFLHGILRAEELLPTVAAREVRNTQRAVALWCGAAVLAKGPLGIAFPGLCAVVSLLVFGKNALRFVVPHPSAILLFLVVACPWYIAAALHGGDAFVERQLFFENLSRFVGGEGISSKPWHFYFGAFFSGAFPWSLLALFTVPLVCKDRLGKLFAYYWLAALCFLSCAEGKRSSYLLALWPFIAMHCAVALRALTVSDFRWMRLGISTVQWIVGILVTLFVLGAALLAALPLTGNTPLTWVREVIVPHVALLSVSLAALILLPTIVRCIKRVRSLSPETSFAAWLTVCALLLVGYQGAGLAVKSALKGYPNAALEAQQAINAAQASGGVELHVIRTRLDETSDPMLFLVGRRFEIADPSVSIAQFCSRALASSKTQILLAPTSWLSSNEIQPVSDLSTQNGSRESLLPVTAQGCSPIKGIRVRTVASYPRHASHAYLPRDLSPNRSRDSPRSGSIDASFIEIVP